MKIVADTGPLVAAANRRDHAHELAAEIVAEVGRDLVVPTPVIAEVDHLVRGRADAVRARLFLDAIDTGVHAVAYLTPGLLSAAVQFDRRYSALNLGFVDACVMAIAERGGWPVLTFDFEAFRATRPSSGHWRLVVDEARYAEATRGD